jgi:hypothetical protein
MSNTRTPRSPTTPPPNDSQVAVGVDLRPIAAWQRSVARQLLGLLAAAPAAFWRRCSSHRMIRNTTLASIDTRYAMFFPNDDQSGQAAFASVVS